MSEKKFSVYYHSRLSSVICELVDLVLTNPSSERLTSYTLTSFNTSLKQLSKADKSDIPQHLCHPQHDRIQSVLMHMRVRMATEFRVYKQWKLFEVLREIVTNHVGDYLSTPSVWRPILDFIRWMLPEFDQRVRQQYKPIAYITLKLISQVTNATGPSETAAPVAPSSSSRTSRSAAAAEDSSLNVLTIPNRMPTTDMMRDIRYIITDMIQYSEAENHLQNQEDSIVSQSSDDSSGTSSYKIQLVFTLILSIIHALPSNLHPELSMLPPFPNHILFKEINEAYNLFTHKRGLIDEIMTFLINGKYEFKNN
jgi:hypothetical protein